MQKESLGDKNSSTKGWDQPGCGSPCAPPPLDVAAGLGLLSSSSVTCLPSLLELRAAQNHLYLLLRDQSDRENTAGSLAT